MQRVAPQFDKRATVDVLRRGVVDRNVRIELAYFKPGHGLAPQLVGMVHFAVDPYSVAMTTHLAGKRKRL